jgi:hypothetical protein
MNNPRTTEAMKDGTHMVNAKVEKAFADNVERRVQLCLDEVGGDLCQFMYSHSVYHQYMYVSH